MNSTFLSDCLFCLLLIQWLWSPNETWHLGYMYQYLIIYIQPSTMPIVVASVGPQGGWDSWTCWSFTLPYLQIFLPTPAFDVHSVMIWSSLINLAVFVSHIANFLDWKVLWSLNLQWIEACIISDLRLRLLSPLSSNWVCLKSYTNRPYNKLWCRWS